MTEQALDLALAAPKPMGGPDAGDTAETIEKLSRDTPETFARRLHRHFAATIAADDWSGEYSQ